jgi:Flp pilus assembly CpaE family ATPase
MWEVLTSRVPMYAFIGIAVFVVSVFAVQEYRVVSLHGRLADRNATISGMEETWAKVKNDQAQAALDEVTRLEGEKQKVDQAYVDTNTRLEAAQHDLDQAREQIIGQKPSPVICRPSDDLVRSWQGSAATRTASHPAAQGSGPGSVDAARP